MTKEAISNRDKIMKCLTDTNKLTGGHCGNTLASLRNKTCVDIKDLKKCLRTLYNENLILARDGVHGKLIFKI